MNAPNCATDGHSRIPATHQVTWSTPVGRDEPVTEPVCEACAADFSRRTYLQATATLIGAS
jgi:hypothetical protein